jgi:hypothetical protein
MKSQSHNQVQSLIGITAFLMFVTISSLLPEWSPGKQLIPDWNGFNECINTDHHECPEDSMLNTGILVKKLSQSQSDQLLTVLIDEKKDDGESESHNLHNPNRDRRNFDHVINQKGESRITIATGIPFIGIAEYAYGVSNRTTLGIMAGMTPAVEGYGIRFRRILYQKSESYRIYFCTPVIYYPTLSGGDPWWLTRPNINFEWLTQSDLRYKIGGSIIAAASNNSLFGDSSKATLSPDMWTSIHGGISMPLYGSFSFQAEASYVSKGIQPIKEFVGAPPVILVLGVSYIF